MSRRGKLGVDGNRGGSSPSSFEDGEKVFVKAGVPHIIAVKVARPATGEEYLLPVYTIYGKYLCMLL